MAFWVSGLNLCQAEEFGDPEGATRRTTALLDQEKIPQMEQNMQPWRSGLAEAACGHPDLQKPSKDGRED